MDMEVTSVSKEQQKLAQVAAAVFVITQEDIRHSGATNVPDLLRMVPGMDVAQINANTWAISARGFNSQFANKLLVILDGRAVYTPLLGGVSWDTVDVPFATIDRIEVIRGPGGTVWGDNAVNGVINIITKKAQDTLGTTVTAGGGTSEQGFGAVQYGGAIKSGGAYRVFADYLNQDHLPDLNGQNGHDGLHLMHGGFRFDSNPSAGDQVTVQGDIYSGGEGSSFVHTVLSPPENVNVYGSAGLSGGDILGRWSHAFSSTSDLTVQAYFDRYTRTGPESSEVRNTIDLDLRHHIVLGSRNDLTWGMGLRYSADRTVGTIDQAFLPADRSGTLVNFFVQDQIILKQDRLFLYVGTKLENGLYSGFDLSPSARLAWTPNSRQTFWTAVSNAHRTPTRHDQDLSASLAGLPGPAEVLLVGNTNFQSENLNAYEAGYRSQINKRLSVDLAAFVNSYNHLQTQEPLPSFVVPNSTPPLLVYPISFANKMHGVTEGIEASVQWTATPRWILSPGYSYLQMHLHTDPSSLDTTSVANVQGSNPVHQAQLRSRFKLTRSMDWDLNVYYTGALPAQLVPSYTRLDSQVTWRVSERTQWSVVGQNLLSDHHVEANDAYAVVNSSEIKRSVYTKLVWSF
jgi:iron complex outermembrane recepter protein